jgi:hypothetical protein
VLEAMFVLLEFSSPSRRIFIGSHSLPPSLVRRIGPSKVNQVVLENSPQNCQMIDHKIHKQLIAACAHETTKFIIEELGDECFAILADESSDAYLQEQLAVCLGYVNKKGEPVERFLGLVHVEDTTTLTLKEAIQSLLMKYQLPLSKVLPVLRGSFL